MLLNVRRLARICHDERVALIHARSRAPAWVALGAARSLNLPFVTTYHGSYAGPLVRQGPLQFGHGARRRGHRQFPLHRRT